MGEALTRCLDDERPISFGNSPMADLFDIHQRMAFMVKAAARFDELLQHPDRHPIEQAILDIAAGRGVR